MTNTKLAQLTVKGYADGRLEVSWFQFVKLHLLWIIFSLKQGLIN